MTTTTITPNVFYKYVPCENWLPAFLSGDSLRFSSRKDFNDPFDSMPAYYIDTESPEGKAFTKQKLAIIKNPSDRIRAYQQLKNKNNTPKALGGLGSDLDEIGILSLSEAWNIPLLWSHYAAMHRGVCVGFHADSDVFVFAEAVIYQEAFPIIKRPHDSMEEMLRKTFYTKDSCWSYEKEWRILKRKATANELAAYKREVDEFPDDDSRRAVLEQYGPGIYAFNPDSIESITVGMHVPNSQLEIVKDHARRLCVPVYKIKPPHTTYKLERELLWRPAGEKRRAAASRRNKPKE